MEESESLLTSAAAGKDLGRAAAASLPLHNGGGSYFTPALASGAGRLKFMLVETSPISGMALGEPFNQNSGQFPTVYESTSLPTGKPFCAFCFRGHFPDGGALESKCNDGSGNVAGLYGREDRLAWI